MGYYSEYLDKHLSFEDITKERKEQLNKISKLRGGRDVLVYASNLAINAPTSIDYSDILPFQDQLSNLKGSSIDVILETPGGFAEVVEDLVKLIRDRYEKVAIIIPGYAKSAGTIFAMAGDEILMGQTSALGPIDAQISTTNNKRFSAEAFLEGLEKIKQEVIKQGKLNPAYIPILQNISPGEIQHCENAQNFSKKLVTEWLTKYKFKYWDEHNSTGKPVTEAKKKKRANQIASTLCKQSKWLTHGRSIKIKDFEQMRLIIEDFSLHKELNEAILRYYTLLRMSFETNIYKIFETVDSQIYRFSVPQSQKLLDKKKGEVADIQFECPKCKKRFLIQANLKKNVPLKKSAVPYPFDDDVFKCPNCGTESNINTIRLQVESQTGKKIVK